MGKSITKYQYTLCNIPEEQRSPVLTTYTSHSVYPNYQIKEAGQVTALLNSPAGRLLES